jgi:hypothetical protein
LATTPNRLSFDTFVASNVATATPSEKIAPHMAVLANRRDCSDDVSDAAAVKVPRQSLSAALLGGLWR